MHIHILGIGGTFMSALALLARAKGYKVTGHDAKCYPPISDLLTQHGIAYVEGYDEPGEMLNANEVVVGNAIKRGLPIIETLLNAHKSYISGPEWLAREVLANYKILAVSGTHGKTSTSTIAAFILEEAGFEPGYLIGGVPQVLETNAKQGKGEWFVIEADEYDTAFFDKRPKFMHYRPQGLIMHNLEFDHADIYDSLAAIQKQFHYLLRTVPGNGWVVRPFIEKGIDGAIEQGVYSPVITWGQDKQGDVKLELIDADGSTFHLITPDEKIEVSWSLLGAHNVENAVAAMIACRQIGVPYAKSAEILKKYQPVKRRLEICFSHPQLTVYDDFAHHPTAIRRATEAVSHSEKHKRLLAILDFASNSMRAGHHLADIPHALAFVDELYVVEAQGFDLQTEAKKWPCRVHVFSSTDALVEQINQDIKPMDSVLMMSNKGFDKLRAKLLSSLETNPLLMATI
jgi:UDP-N-acetylmuramate: L-alanyl-gamma-D-glutamyl-meso-diaminopimelate ligase